MTLVTGASPGDGDRVIALGALALGLPPLSTPPPSLLATGAAVDRFGEMLPAPYGPAYCDVTRAEGVITGMIYSLSPVRWLDSHPEDSRPQLVGQLMEIELIAVDPAYRRRGIGSALLTHVEQRARERGTRIITAKVADGHWTEMLWYRRRGYTVAAHREPCMFPTRAGGTTSFDDGADGYHAVSKCLIPDMRLRRHHHPRGSYLKPVTCTPAPQPV